MALLTKAKFASLANMASRKLAIYIQRRKVVVDADSGMIDPADQTNVAFLEKHGGVNREVRIKPSVSIEDDAIDESDPETAEDGLMSLSESQREYQHWKAVKQQTLAELDKLKILKLKGDVIPTEPIEGLIFHFKQAVLTQNKITLQAFLSEIGHKYDITPDDMAHYKGYYVNLLNRSAEEANQTFIDGLGSVLAEYSVKK
jgi:hypothetical protein